MTVISFNLEYIYLLLVLFSAASFLWYGYHCLYAPDMKSEFKRFQLSDKQRQLVGISQMLRGLALLLGLAYPILGVLASGGLTIQMFLGFMVRLKIKDSILQAAPSFVFMILNGILFAYFLTTYL